ncbi:MAG TPA: hypothetical protein VF765_26340, partial [Polyangiaceae bacterium]
MRRIATRAIPVVCVTLFATGARASGTLSDESARLADAWRAVGASVVVDKVRFLVDDGDEDRHVVIALPDLPEGECTTVALLGARGLGFHVRLADTSSEEPVVKRVPSVAGALVIERCGEPGPRRLVVSSDSGRGALETIEARSSKPLPPLRTVLPERTGGMIAPAMEPGSLPALPPPERRAEVAEVRARRDGATIAPRQTWNAGPDRAGSGGMVLAPGCHVLQLFAVDPRGVHPGMRGKLDLDGEMRDESGERVLARDRSDAPDVTLVKCVGDTTPVQVVFAGSPPEAPVLVAHFAWSLPVHLPDMWGNEPRARMARVLLERHLTALPADPVSLAQGGYGMTPVPLSIEPGACYLAVVTLVRESARSVGLRVHVGSTVAADDRGIEDDGAAVAFCAGERTTALADVEARGAPLLGWGMALY